MSDSLSFKFKNNVADDKHRIIELFFKNWVDESCNNQVQYRVVRHETGDWRQSFSGYKEAFDAHFDRSEDAVALKLRGIPLEFEKYIEIINKNP